MNAMEAIAGAILRGDALEARSLVQSWIASAPTMEQTPAPTTNDPTLSSLAAGLLEMFCDRLGRTAPIWTRQIGPAPHPMFLVQAASRMKNLRTLCETEGPVQLRRRGFFAPPDYLAAV
jgi:hypothetical protein